MLFRSFWGAFIECRKRKGDIVFPLWTLAFSLTVFLNSSSRPDYFMFYLPGFCFMVSQWRENTGIEKVCVILSFVFIALTQQAVLGRDWNITLQYARVPVVGMALLVFAQTFNVLKPGAMKK